MASNSQEQFIEKKFGALSFGHLTSAPVISQSVNITAAAGATLTATQLLSGTIIRSGAAGGITDELPTGNEVLARLNVLTNSQASVGMSFQVSVLNNNGGLLTFSPSDGNSTGALVSTGQVRLLSGVITSISGTTGTYTFGHI
jgi:hypothetical protein